MSTDRKTIFFDVYQTLIDIDINPEHKKINREKAWETLAQSLKKYGVDVGSSELQRLSEQRKAEFYDGKDAQIHHHDFNWVIAGILKDTFNATLSPEELADVVYGYHVIDRGYARLYPNVSETLAELKDRYSLLVVSYTQACWTQPELRELGIDSFFDHFIYTSDIGFHKESPEFYKKCLEIVGQNPQDCVMIGDNYKADILIPQQIGINTIWIENPATANQHRSLFKIKPQNTVRIEEFNTLPKVIEQLFNQ